jgi:peptidase E
MTTITLISGLATFPQDQLLDLIFPKQITQPILAYTPPNGQHSPKKLTQTWKDLAAKRRSKFLFIDITSPNPQAEKQKLLSANILVLTGGNTFTFLHNLRKSGLDQAIIQFACKQPPGLRTKPSPPEMDKTPGVNSPEIITQPKHITAFSAGAEILTPSIKTVLLSPHPDKNTVKLKNFKGLNIVPFEIFPHFKPEYQTILDNYQKTTKNKVIPLPDGRHITYQAKDL